MNQTELELKIIGLYVKSLDKPKGKVGEDLIVNFLTIFKKANIEYRKHLINELNKTRSIDYGHGAIAPESFAIKIARLYNEHCKWETFLKEN